MDVDFSPEAREFLNKHPKKQVKKLSLAKRVVAALEAKANLHNEKFDQKVTTNQLISVFNRGQAITDWVFCASKSNMQWAFARVNHFLYMHEGKKVAKAYRIADRDIAEGSLEYDVEDHGKGYHDFQELDFAVARLDIKRAGIHESEANTKIKNLVGLQYSPEE